MHRVRNTIACEHGTTNYADSHLSHWKNVEYSECSTPKLPVSFAILV